MRYCKNCGTKMVNGKSFCTACGTKTEEAAAISPEPSRARPDRAKIGIWHDKRFKIALALVGVLLVIGITFFVTKGPFREDEMANRVEREPTEKTYNAKAGDVSSEGKGLESYIEQLEDIEITYQSQSYDLGEWELTEINGKLYMTAEEIPNDSLQQIFSLYDRGHLAPLKTWAKEVFAVAEEISLNQSLPVAIEVGNQCSPLVPTTLPLSVINNYSGSCGYSIPVLNGEEQSDFVLMANTPVFSTSAAVDYILHDSDVRILGLSDISELSKDELRLARNEIYARNGYVFQSDDLQAYFSVKSWYVADPSYDSSLSATEKRNVELIKAREENM